jgi:hypothetical protein
MAAQAERSLPVPGQNIAGLAVPYIEKVFLTQMAQRSSNPNGDLGVVVHNKPYPGRLTQRQQGFRSAADLVDRNSFRAKLDEVSSTVAERLGDLNRPTTRQVSSVDERVELTVR